MKAVLFSCFLIQLLILLAASQRLQEPPRSVTASSLGSCARFEPSLLGNSDSLSTDGLVPQQLLYEAQNTYIQYLTEELPEVQILETTITCESTGNHKNTSNSVSVLVLYDCQGLACLQENATTLVNYTHLFSFMCEEGTNTYVLWSGNYSSYTDRSIVTPLMELEPQLGRCALCVTNFTLTFALVNRYNEDIGCLGRHLNSV